MKPKQLLTSLMALVVCSTFAQNTITVDNSPGANADYADLQPAINFASANDIIYVHASETSYGEVTINKPLYIIGFGHSNPDKNTYLDGIILTNGSDGSYISGLNINGDIITSNTIIINDLIFENNSIHDIEFNGLGANNVLIRGNVIRRIGTSGNDDYTNTLITNNVIASGGTSGIFLKNHESIIIRNNIFLYATEVYNQNASTGDIVVQNCIFYRISGPTLDWNNNGVIFENCLTYNPNGATTPLVGTGNWDDTNPNFVYVDDDVWNPAFDFHLQAGSVAIGAGVNGENLGIYDGMTPFLFNNFGFTAGIPSVTITAITEQVAPGDNIEVTIQSNSN